jgi:hypothetical protein
MNTLIVYSEINGSRIQYTFSEIIRYTHYQSFQLISPAQFRENTDTNSDVLWYDESKAPLGVLAIKPSGFLKEGTDIIAPEKVYWIEKVPYFFQTDPDTLTPGSFDVPAMIFFMLSRSEEYTSSKDILGRTEAQTCTAAKHSFLHIPVVDIWKLTLINLLNAKLHLSQSDKRLIHQEKDALTVDIDMAYAWKYKPFGLKLWALIKYASKFNLKPLLRMLSVWVNKATDPYDTTNYLQGLGEEASTELVFFILSGKRSSLDRNLPASHPVMIRLLQKLIKKATVGLHPSYRSTKNRTELILEKKALEHAIKQTVTKSRQHYLLLKFPDTYRQLIASGIHEDHSMLFHDMPGYRAGTALPFQWYDLPKETTTSLTIVTYVTMDVTLKKYLCLNPVEATDLLKKMRIKAKENHLPFKIVWHNSSLDGSPGWDGWKRVLEKTLLDNNEIKIDHEDA